MRKLSILLVALVAAFVPLLGAAPPASASSAVCALYCDTRDLSAAAQETFPTPDVYVNGRVVRLHVDDIESMAWASIDNGQLNDSVWIDRSWDGGTTWDGLLGQAWIPGTWTGTRALMYNMASPAAHARAVGRACGDANGVVCTSWVHLDVCAAQCDGASANAADPSPVASTAPTRPSSPPKAMLC